MKLWNKTSRKKIGRRGLQKALRSIFTKRVAAGLERWENAQEYDIEIEENCTQKRAYRAKLKALQTK